MGELIHSPINKVKPYCTVFNTFLDIGCGNAHILYTFENLGFTKMIGIDEEIKFSSFYHYCNYKNLKTIESIHLRDEINAKFSFFRSDARKYIYEIREYSFILMRYFLHFIPDQDKYALIKRLYNLLEPGGIIYMVLNHNQNANNTDPKIMDKIDENTYRSKTGLKTTRYLVNKENFISNMKPYTKIEELCSCSENEITLVITKPL